MKCQIPFSGKNKKKYHQFVVCQFAHRVVKVIKVEVQSEALGPVVHKHR